MSFGRTIRIYLENGNVTGIRHFEIVNWSGQGIFTPRIQIKELSEWAEAKKPGVYLLFGADEQSEKPAVYIGESENILTRLNQHLSKDFWNEAVLFTSKDDNLTKSHIRYLEARLIELSKKANRYVIQNGNDATESVLPRSDKDTMEKFLSNIRILLGTMGHKVLETIISQSSKNKDEPENISLEFHLKGNVNAIAILSDEGIIVKKNSQAKIINAPSLSAGYVNLKEQLVKDNILIKKDNNFYVFVEDYLFKSSSQAAAIIVGCPTSGPQNWVCGKLTLKEFEEKRIKDVN